MPDRLAGAGLDTATASVHENALIAARVDLSPSVACFRIRGDGPLPHVEAGQYVPLGRSVDGRLIQRPYSTASPSGIHEEIEFLIRLVPGGTFTSLLWRLGPDDRLHIGRPKGLFTLVPGDRRTHVFIATGTGLAPFVAMLETMLREPAPPQAIVVHGVSHEPELAYRDRLECWAGRGQVTYVPCISRPADPSNAGWTGRTGRIDAILDESCTELGIVPDDTVAYLCGNPEMIAAGERILTERGLPRDAVRSERYWPG